MQDRWGIKLDKVEVKECLSFGEWGTDAYWSCVVRVVTGPENHQVGTCKMGNSNDPTAVVDPELKVIGVRGQFNILYFIGSWTNQQVQSRFINITENLSNKSALPNLT